jgi:hypothetical protein
MLSFSDAFKRLLEHSLSIARDVNSKLTESFYKKNNHSSFHNLIFPFIESDEMEQLLIILQNEKKLGEYYFTAKPVSIKNGTMGILITYEPEAPDLITTFSVKMDKSRSECWHRFIIMKEMCQLYCDKNYGSNLLNGEAVTDQIYHLISRHIDLKNDPGHFELDATDENYNEFLSFYVAINLAFPQEFWKELKNLCLPLLEESLDCPYKYYDVAEALMMPEFVLRYFVKRLLPYYEATLKT